MRSEDTEDLIARAKAGDEEAQAHLFDVAAERVLLYLRLRMGEQLRRERDSLDVMQEAFISAHRDLPKSDVKTLGDYFAWICRITENRLRDHAAHDGAQKRQAPGEREAISAVLDRVRARHQGPQTAALFEERRAAVIAAIDGEPEECRRVLLGRFFEGRTIDDLATELGRSPTGVRRLLGEAAIRLGSTLGELGDLS